MFSCSSEACQPIAGNPIYLDGQRRCLKLQTMHFSVTLPFYRHRDYDETNYHWFGSFTFWNLSGPNGIYEHQLNWNCAAVRHALWFQQLIQYSWYLGSTWENLWKNSCLVPFHQTLWIFLKGKRKEHDSNGNIPLFHPILLVG